MHGSPLLRALAAFLAILSLGLPLWKLTHQTEAQPTVQVEPKSVEAKAIHLQLSFTQVPSGFRILSLGKEIWNEAKPAAEMSRDFQLAYPKEGIDLELQIDWPGDSLSAVRLQLRNPEGKDVEQSVWGKGQTDEVVTFE